MKKKCIQNGKKKKNKKKKGCHGELPFIYLFGFYKNSLIFFIFSEKKRKENFKKPKIPSLSLLAANTNKSQQQIRVNTKVRRLEETNSLINTLFCVCAIL